VRAYESEALLVALKLGAGLCQLPDNMVEDELADGTLVELLPSCRPEPLPIQLVHPPGRLLPARVRAAIDALDLPGLRRRAQ
jgi:DNA-binding transcriptional LysR family regulator